MIAFAILILNLVATLAMVGLIWFVQVVHYPLFSQVGRAEFQNYERLHQQRTTSVVLPLMVTEAATSMALLWIRPSGIPLIPVASGAALVIALWLSTFLWQVPAHTRLGAGFDEETHHGLVLSNWFRTFGWTARGILAVWMLYLGGNFS